MLIPMHQHPQVLIALSECPEARTPGLMAADNVSYKAVIGWGDGAPALETYLVAVKTDDFQLAS